MQLVEQYKLSISKERVLRKVNKKYGNGFTQTATVNGQEIPLKTCMAIYGNGGVTTLPGGTRASRFFSHVYEDIVLENRCRSTPTHHVYKIGDKYNSSSLCGKIVALSYKKRSKGLNYPAVSLCGCFGMFRCAWIHVKKNKKYFVEKVKLK